MTTGSFSRSDLNRINNVVQNTQFSFVKEIIVAILRDEFSKDSFYNYVGDSYGFPKTPDMLGLPTDAGFEDELTTRIFIGEKWRFNAILYPAILVASGSSKYTPIAFNRNKETIQYEAISLIDGYGNQTVITIPSAFTLAGAWDMTVSVDIHTRDILSRDHLTSFCNLLFSDIRHDDLLKAGILVKGVSAGSPSEGDDRQQDKLYKQSITLDIRTEWRREIPIESLIDVINVCVEFGNLEVEPPVINPNLTINATIQLIDQIENL